MVMNPSVMKRAQEEIDKVTHINGPGQSRLPTFDDREKLPYINALIKEVFRWAVVAPFGLPHCAIDDDRHNGCRIPKGTVVIPNVW
jgi:cytochrome P450